MVLPLLLPAHGAVRPKVPNAHVLLTAHLRGPALLVLTMLLQLRQPRPITAVLRPPPQALLTLVFLP